MKTCPACGATYTARISFCFEDGAVLVVNEVAAAGAQAASHNRGNRGAAPRVPSRVATPVSPARRGRSLLSSKGSPLSFSPPRASSDGRRQRAQELAPAPLEPLEIAEEVLQEELDVAPANLAQADQGGFADAPEHVPEGASPPPTPAGAGGHLTPPTSAPESTYDDLDFPEMGVGSQDDERRGGLPPWVLPALAGAAALVIVVGGVVGGAVGLLGTGALIRDDGDAVADVDPAPVPAEVAADVAIVGTEPAPEPGPEPRPVPVSAAPSPAPVAPSPAPEPVVADIGEPSPRPAPVVPAPEPDGSPWGVIEVPTSQVSFTSTPPGAQILVDGAPAGKTPISLDLDHGDHTVEAILEGHGSESRTVTVGGRALDIPFDLVPTAKSGAVIVVLEGWDGAILYVDGEKSGVLPARIQLTEGNHEFKVESPSGTQSVNRDVVFAEGGVTIVNLSG